MTRKCPSCSADVLDNAKFCIKCGTKMPTLTPSPSAATPFAPSNPPPTPIREPSIAESVSVGGSVNVPLKEKEAISQPDESGVKEEVRSSNPAPTNKAEIKAAKSGGKSIIYAVIGIVIVGGGAFFFMSNKQTPIQAPASVSAPAGTTTSPTAPAPAPAPAPVTPAPAKPIAPALPATPKPTQKPMEPSAPAPSAPAPTAPDINKIMRDAVNK